MRLLLLTIFHVELIPSVSPQTCGATTVESWLIIPLFPVGIFLGWGERQMLICCVTNLFIYLFIYLFILGCIKFLMENYKHNIIEKYIFQKNICSLACLHTHLRIMCTGPVRILM